MTERSRDLSSGEEREEEGRGENWWDLLLHWHLEGEMISDVARGKAARN